MHSAVPCTYRPLVGMASRHEAIQPLEVSPKNIACADDPNTDGFSTWISLLVHERLLARAGLTPFRRDQSVKDSVVTLRG